MERLPVTMSSWTIDSFHFGYVPSGRMSLILWMDDLSGISSTKGDGSCEPFGKNSSKFSGN